MRRLSIITFIMVSFFQHSASATLLEYVNKPDDTYAFELTGTREAGQCTAYVIRMTSQTWQGIVWQHWLTILKPAEIKDPSKAILFITGGDNDNDSPRFNSSQGRIIAQIAASTGTLGVILEQVPNQPLFDGKTEDGIIALTFDKFLKGEGDDWPLLLPMVKSAVRAMDTVQQVAKSEFGAGPEGFMVLGGSKRGWTTWLSAVADKRVIGIAPAVIDMLNMVPQTENQLKSYGTYSDEIIDYTLLNIQGRAGSPEGERLRAIVDPYSYRDTLTLPKLVVLGTNDPYWNVDSANNYFPGLKGDKYLVYCANTPHDVNPSGVATIMAFYNALLKGEPLQPISWEHHGDGSLNVSWSQAGAKILHWSATAPSRDFRQAAWTSTELTGDTSVTVTPEVPANGWMAYYVEVIQNTPHGTYGLCTTMTVLPQTYPFPDAVAKLYAAGDNTKS
ncbi:MAG: hypothetical protein IT364_25025 [Candidatus Hydrogenedentes bacterium]|nr:hypothetical protein [Candidatus Hydrogenedentota bacterium]